MRGMGRLWQAAGTVNAVLVPNMIEKAARCGLRSLFIGFETLNCDNLRTQREFQNIGDYSIAIRRLHDLGVMINASFVFGMDEDGPDVFQRTVDWAVSRGMETSTFHILTPYPDTPLFRRMESEGRITSLDWNRYDTRHAVFTPRRMSAGELEEGYWRAYREFYSWTNILRSTVQQDDLLNKLRHSACKTAWKKFETFWDWVIRLKHVSSFTPLLETLLSGSSVSQSNREDANLNDRGSLSRFPKSTPALRTNLEFGDAFPFPLKETRQACFKPSELVLS
jgi:radical SAM superfamily enzyme YgiQ (UPF0313 family)